MLHLGRGPLLALLALGLALLFGGMPAYAHMGEAHTGQSVETPDTAGASTSEMPMQQMEMTWPSGDDSGGMMMRHKEGPKTMMGRTVSWLGAWHPAVIHFPIALLLTVAFLELAAWFTHKPVYAASNKLLLALATLGAFAAAPLGWANAGLPTPDEGWALNAHRWIGSTVPFLFGKRCSAPTFCA